MLQIASKPSLGLHRQMACNHSQSKARMTERKKERKKKRMGERNNKKRGEKLITITNKEIYTENQFAVFPEKLSGTSDRNFLQFFSNPCGSRAARSMPKTCNSAGHCNTIPDHHFSIN